MSFERFMYSQGEHSADDLKEMAICIAVEHEGETGWAPVVSALCRAYVAAVDAEDYDSDAEAVVMLDWPEADTFACKLYCKLTGEADDVNSGYGWPESLPEESLPRSVVATVVRCEAQKDNATKRMLRKMHEERRNA